MKVCSRKRSLPVVLSWSSICKPLFNVCWLQPPASQFLFHSFWPAFWSIDVTVVESGIRKGRNFTRGCSRASVCVPVSGHTGWMTDIRRNRSVMKGSRIRFTASRWQPSVCTHHAGGKRQRNGSVRTWLPYSNTASTTGGLRHQSPPPPDTQVRENRSNNLHSSCFRNKFQWISLVERQRERQRNRGSSAATVTNTTGPSCIDRCLPNLGSKWKELQNLNIRVSLFLTRNSFHLR